MHTRIPCLRLFATALPVSALAQVPVGQALHGSIAPGAPALMVIDRASNVTPVTGSSLADFNSVAMDPIDSTIWLASSTGGGVTRAVMSGPGTITAEPITATLPAGAINAITFDIDGHAVAVGGAINTTTGGVYRIDRNTGAVTLLYGGPGVPQVGTINAAERDPLTGDIYIGLFTSGQVHKLVPPAYNAPTLVGAATLTNVLSGLTFARTPANPQGILYLSCFLSGLNASLQSLDVATGVTTAIPGTPRWNNLQWVDYDDVVGDLWLCATADSRRVLLSPVTGNWTVIHTFAAGTPACIEVNDVDPAIAALAVCPQFVPATPAPIRLELGVAGNPGEYAVVAIVAPFVALIGSGLVDSGGKFATSVPGLVIGAGRPGAARFVAATVDLTTLAIKVSALASWPAN